MRIELTLSGGIALAPIDDASDVRRALDQLDVAAAKQLVDKAEATRALRTLGAIQGALETIN